MKNIAVLKMVRHQFNTASDITVEFLCSEEGMETYRVVLCEGDVRKEYELTIKNQLTKVEHLV